MIYIPKHCGRFLLSILSILTATTNNNRNTTSSFFFAAAFSPQLSFRSEQPRSIQSTAMSSTSSSSSPSKLKSSLSPRVLETLDPCVVLMKELIGKYSHLWEDKGGIFSLAQGVVYWEPPPSCNQALKDAFSDPDKINDLLLHTYGPAQGIPELTKALTEKIARENGLTNHDVMVTVGANQAFVNCVLTCLHGDSKCVVFKPYYFNHVMALQMCCGDDSVVAGPCNNEGIPDLEWLETTLKEESIDMVSFVNPGNPTGVSYSKDYLQNIVDLCGKYNTWLVLDCTYEYFTLPADHQPVATFPDAPHVIHIFSFSKSYSLAGYRCGYLVLPRETDDEEGQPSALLSNMLKVQDTLPIGPPRVSQIAALGSLQGGGPEWVREKYATLAPSRDLIRNALQPMTLMGGTGAMYVMARLPNDENGETLDDVELCRRLVEEHGIAIIPGSFCGFPGWYVHRGFDDWWIVIICVSLFWFQLGH